jgi:hypothetical protein
LNVRFFVAPPTARWITAYPSGHGQDDRVGSAVARRLAHHLIQLQVHDSAIFAYQYHHAGREVDSFSSIPDYFGAIPHEEHTRLRGRPNALTPILRDGAAATRPLADILDPQADEQAPADGRLTKALRAVERARTAGEPPPVDEIEVLARAVSAATDRMRRVATLLGIKGAAGAYEYIEDGETPTSGYTKSKLTHIPDLGAERAAARRTASEARAEVKRLRAMRHLLVDQHTKGKGRWPPPTPAWTPDAHGGYFTVSASGFSTSAVQLERLTAPWTDPQVAFAVATTVSCIATSAAGDILALGHGFGEWSVEVYDVATGARRFRAPIARAAESLRFSRDGRVLVVRSELEIALFDVATGERSVTLKTPSIGRIVAMHPGGTIALVSDQQVGFNVVDLERGAIVGAIDVPSAEAEAIGIKATGHTFAATFTHDGARLCVSTDATLSVYAWPAVRDTGTLAAPESVVASRRGSLGSSGSIPAFGIVHDPQRNLLVYGGEPGELRALSLDTGEDRLLQVVPTRPWISKLDRSADGSTIAITTQGRRGDRKREPHFQVWSYEALLLREHPDRS